MKDSAFYERVRRAFANLEVLHDQEFGAVQPKWTTSIDPQTGIVMIAFRPDLLADRRAIHEMVSTLEMRMQDLCNKVNDYAGV